MNEKPRLRVLNVLELETKDSPQLLDDFGALLSRPFVVTYNELDTSRLEIIGEIVYLEQKEQAETRSILRVYGQNVKKEAEDLESQLELNDFHRLLLARQAKILRLRTEDLLQEFAKGRQDTIDETFSALRTGPRTLTGVTEYFEGSDSTSLYASALSLNRSLSKLYLIERFKTLKKEAESARVGVQLGLAPSNVNMRKNRLESDLASLNKENELPASSRNAMRVIVSRLLVARRMRILEELDSFIAKEAGVVPTVATEIRRTFFATIEAESWEEKSLEKHVAVLKGIILAANRLGEAIQNELYR